VQEDPRNERTPSEVEAEEDPRNEKSPKEVEDEQETVVSTDCTI
jgi:hypothetical protein